MDAGLSKLHLIALAALPSSWLLPDRLRPGLLRRLGLAIGPDVAICSGTRFLGNDVTVGQSSFINYDCVIDSTGATVTIGAEVDLAPQVMITTFTHEHGTARRRAGTPTVAPVRIGDGCWLGLRASILPGVTVGEGCLIAAGAVVTRDCAPHGLYAGVPARRIRDLAADEPLDAGAAAGVLVSV